MASLQELRKRLRSIRSTGQLAGAMRTAASAKLARISKVRGEFSAYASASRNMLQVMGGAGVRPASEKVSTRECIVILGGNRGLCGGFNAELMRFLDERLAERKDPFLLVAGRRAASYLKERGALYEEFAISDVPDYQEVKPLAERARDLYVSGEAARVFVIWQRYQNMLTQTPTERRLLPEGNDGEQSGEPLPDEDLLWLPDKETIGQQLAENCFDAQIYDLVLENAVGAQAATLMAMRSACDNAETAASELEVLINRCRQADVTSGVIETASGSIQQGD